MADTKGTVKRASRNFMLFSAALRQNVLKSDVACLPTDVQICFAKNKAHAYIKIQEKNYP